MKKVWSIYSQAIAFAVKHWQLWIMIYLFNLVYCFLAVLPIRSWLASAFEHSPNLTLLSESFDLNTLMDLLHANSSVMSLVIPLVCIALVLYFLWINFFVGGVLGCYRDGQFNMSRFFSDAIKFLFPNIRLSLYVIAFYLILVTMAFLLFAKDGIHVLEMQNEDALIFRFQWLTTLIFTIAFFVGIFKEMVRAQIVSQDMKWFSTAIKKCFVNTFKPDVLLLGFFNLLGLVVVVVLHYCIVTSAYLNSHYIMMLIFSQTLLIFRIMLKLSRLGGFYRISLDENL